MTADRLKRITVEEGKCGGGPCIRGASHDEILSDYTFLEPEDIFAAIEYAAHQADHTVLQVL